MSKFSRASVTKLATCDVRLQSVFHAVIERFDCTIVCGLRTRDEQSEAFRTGNSKKKWPDSKHNVSDGLLFSRAVDVAPYPINWKDLDRFRLFGGYVLGTADQLGIALRWGGDWDSDKDLNDQTFNDLAHFELKGS